MLHDHEGFCITEVFIARCVVGCGSALIDSTKTIPDQDLALCQLSRTAAT